MNVSDILEANVFENKQVLTHIFLINRYNFYLYKYKDDLIKSRGVLSLAVIDTSDNCIGYKHFLEKIL